MESRTMPDRDKFIWRKHLLAWGYKSRLRLSPWQSPRLWKGPVTYEVIAQVRKKGWRGTALKQSVCGKTSQGFTVGTVLYHSFRFLKEVGNRSALLYMWSHYLKRISTRSVYSPTKPISIKNQVFAGNDGWENLDYTGHRSLRVI